MTNDVVRIVNHRGRDMVARRLGGELTGLSGPSRRSFIGDPAQDRPPEACR